VAVGKIVEGLLQGTDWVVVLSEELVMRNDGQVGNDISGRIRGYVSVRVSVSTSIRYIDIVVPVTLASKTEEAFRNYSCTSVAIPHFQLLLLFAGV